jgi:RHS repeat-associated protein
MHDFETGLDWPAHGGPRPYDPMIGRWCSRDKIAGFIVSPQSMNRYTYALNNPLRFIDIDGNLSTEYNKLAKGVPREVFLTKNKEFIISKKVTITKNMENMLNVVATSLG